MDGMGSTMVEVQLEVIPQADSDAAELEELALELRALLLDLGVEGAELVSGGTAPQGAKSLLGIFTGGIVVTAAGTSLRGLLSLAETWVKSRPVRSVKATVNGHSIEVNSASRDDIRRVLARWEAAASQPQIQVPAEAIAAPEATETPASASQS